MKVALLLGYLELRSLMVFTDKIPLFNIFLGREDLVFCLCNKKPVSGFGVLMFPFPYNNVLLVFIREQKTAHQNRFCYDYLIISFHYGAMGKTLL